MQSRFEDERPPTLESEENAPNVPWQRSYQSHLSKVQHDQDLYKRKVKMAKTDEEKLKLKREQVAKLKADIQALENKAKRDERKRDTRRKILAGAYLLELVERGQYPLERFQLEMQGFLTRAQDFALFGLEAPSPGDD